MKEEKKPQPQPERKPIGITKMRVEKYRTILIFRFYTIEGEERTLGWEMN